MEDTSLNPPVPIIEDEPVEQTTEAETAAPEVCQSCNTVAELFDVAHHQTGNPTVWRYCKRCKMVHDVEVATNAKLREIMAVNPAAVNDPAFVGQVRDQLTKEMLQA